MICPELLEFVNKHTMHFDESHDINHALAVYRNAIIIAENDYPNYDQDIIMYSSLLHDVCDYKYDTITTIQLKEFIIKSLPSEKVDPIMDIINNISYSKEIKGLRKKLDAPYNVYLDIVSDADKLEDLNKI